MRLRRNRWKSSRLGRKLVLLASVVASIGCSGGSGLTPGSGGQQDIVIITAQGPQNLPRVLAGSGLALSAVAVTGSQNTIVNINRFIWSAMITTGQRYAVNAFGQTAPCASVMTAGGTPSTADVGIDIAIDPTNEANIIFFPPLVLSTLNGGPVTVNYPYCVAVAARAFNDSKARQFVGTGSIIVAVEDPLNPLP